MQIFLFGLISRQVGFDFMLDNFLEHWYLISMFIPRALETSPVVTATVRFVNIFRNKWMVSVWPSDREFRALHFMFCYKFSLHSYQGQVYYGCRCVVMLEFPHIWIWYFLAECPKQTRHQPKYNIIYS